MKNLKILCVIITGLIPSSVMAGKAEVNEAVGHIMAASLSANACKGVEPIGDGSGQDYIMAASEKATKKGVRTQKLRKLLFYAKTTDLNEAGEYALSKRGHSLKAESKLCKFARGVAGSDDPIGKFLR